MLLVIENEQFLTWHVGNPVTPLPYWGEVVIVFDPSKTNMAMVVSTPDGTQLAHVEFSGNNRRNGPVDDTTVYCYEVRMFLQQFLKNCRVYLAAVEEALTVKGEKSNHYTNKTLMEIRANILSFFLETYGIKVIEINNWAWKFDVLPEGFRGKYEKGSKKYFLKYFPDSRFSHFFEADMTDVMCILQYVIRHFCNNYTLYCNQPEEKLSEYSYLFAEAGREFPNERSVLCNPNYSLVENMNYYANRIFGVFTMVVNAEDVDVSMFYNHSLSASFDSIDNDKVKVVVSRK